jgi:hypothetical protein
MSLGAVWEKNDNTTEVNVPRELATGMNLLCNDTTRNSQAQCIRPAFPWALEDSGWLGGVKVVVFRRLVDNDIALSFLQTHLALESSARIGATRLRFWLTHVQVY